jgi:predicted RNA binding protein YcfA (HicA-like mRNA interferase family)
MSKKQKLLQRLLSKPKDLRYDELDKILQACGYTLDHSTGSHAIYSRRGARSLTIPRTTPVKSYLIEQVLDAIEDCIEEKL